MGFGQAVSVCFAKYFDFSGRARRSEFWWFYLFTVIVNAIANILDVSIGTVFFKFIAIVLLILPALAVAVRRLHDTGRTGFWIFLNIIPVIGTIVLIVFYVQDSDADNIYGPNPKLISGLL